MQLKRKIEVEFKVGLFITIGIVLTMLAIILMGGTTSFISKQHTYKTNFSNVEGLIPGARVSLNGIRVGVVTEVNFRAQAKDIEVTMSIAHAYRQMITDQTIAEIATQGVLGDKFIAITSVTEGGTVLDPGSTIRGSEGGGLAGFLSNSEELLENLKSLAKNMDKTMASFTAKGRNEVFFEGLAATAKHMAQVSKKLDSEVSDMKLKSTINNLNSILQKIDSGKGTMGALVNDPDLYNDARSLLGGVNRNRVMRNLIRKTIKDTEKERSETILQEDKEQAKEQERKAASE